MNAPLNLHRMLQQLVLHEGTEPRPYRCSASKLTIGHGYNIDARGLGPMSKALGRTVTIEELYDKGLTSEDSRVVLAADVAEFERRVRAKWPTYDRLDEVRKRVVIDFVFNVGGAGALAFKAAIARLELALRQADADLRQACWDACAFHIMDSLWSNQVDDGLGGKYGRADRLCHMLRTGKDYTK